MSTPAIGKENTAPAKPVGFAPISGKMKTASGTAVVTVQPAGPQPTPTVKVFAATPLLDLSAHIASSSFFIPTGDRPHPTGPHVFFSEPKPTAAPAAAPAPSPSPVDLSAFSFSPTPPPQLNLVFVAQKSRSPSPTPTPPPVGAFKSPSPSPKPEASSAESSARSPTPMPSIQNRISPPVGPAAGQTTFTMVAYPAPSRSPSPSNSPGAGAGVASTVPSVPPGGAALPTPSPSPSAGSPSPAPTPEALAVLYASIGCATIAPFGAASAAAPRKTVEDLFAAFDREDLNAINALIWELPKSELDRGDKKGFTPAHYAAANCMSGVIMNLKLRGATLDAKSGAGHTPLDLVARLQKIAYDGQQWDDLDDLKEAEHTLLYQGAQARTLPQFVETTSHHIIQPKKPSEKHHEPILLKNGVTVAMWIHYQITERSSTKYAVHQTNKISALANESMGPSLGADARDIDRAKKKISVAVKVANAAVVRLARTVGPEKVMQNDPKRSRQ